MRILDSVPEGGWGGRSSSRTGRVAQDVELARIIGEMHPTLRGARRSYAERYGKNAPARAGIAWFLKGEAEVMSDNKTN